MWAGFPRFVEFWMAKTLPTYPNQDAQWQDATAILKSFRYDPVRAQKYLESISKPEDIIGWLWYADGTYREETMVRMNIGFALLLPSLLGHEPEDPETSLWMRLFQPTLPQTDEPLGGIPAAEIWDYLIQPEGISRLAKTGVSATALAKFIPEPGHAFPFETAWQFAQGHLPLEYALALLDTPTDTG